MKSKVSETQWESLAGAKADAAFSKRTGAGSVVKAAPSVPLALLFQGRIFPVHGSWVKPTTATATKKEDKTPYAERGNRNRVTCERLFCKGDSDTDGFSRTIALRYLSKRMVYAVRGNAKGKEDAPDTLRGRKVSSNRHAMTFYAASDIEDIIQDAFILYSQDERLRTGDRLRDTCNAARRAYTRFIRAQWKEKRRVDVLAARIASRETRERSLANRFYDAELDALLDAVRIHGVNNQKELANALGVDPGNLCRLLQRLRDRCERRNA